MVDLSKRQREYRSRKSRTTSKGSTISSLSCRDFPIGRMKNFFGRPCRRDINVVPSVRSSFDSISKSDQNLSRYSFHYSVASHPRSLSTLLDRILPTRVTRRRSLPGTYSDPCIHRIYTGWHARKQT